MPKGTWHATVIPSFPIFGSQLQASLRLPVIHKHPLPAPSGFQLWVSLQTSNFKAKNNNNVPSHLSLLVSSAFLTTRCLVAYCFPTVFLFQLSHTTIIIPEYSLYTTLLGILCSLITHYLICDHHSNPSSFVSGPLIRSPGPEPLKQHGNFLSSSCLKRI